MLCNSFLPDMNCSGRPTYRRTISSRWLRLSSFDLHTQKFVVRFICNLTIEFNSMHRFFIAQLEAFFPIIPRCSDAICILKFYVMKSFWIPCYANIARLQLTFVCFASVNTHNEAICRFVAITKNGASSSFELSFAF